MSQERYFGTWTVSYRWKGRVRKFMHLNGYTKADAIASAKRYLAGFNIKIVDAWKEPTRQVQLNLFPEAA